MRRTLNQTEGIFPMPVLMIATYNEDGSVNVMKMGLQKSKAYCGISKRTIP